MSDHPFQFRRPTPLEDQAYTEVRRHFDEHLKQHSTSHEAVRQLERDIARTAIAVNLAASKAQPAGISIQTEDGAQWRKGVELFDNISIFHRPDRSATEYATVQQFPNGRTEIWNRGHNAVEVLRAFTNDQKHTLKTWAEDIKAQVTEFLAEKYPGQDMNRVAEAFVLQCAEPISRRQAITQSNGQKQGRGIGV